jgi:hypothetical protein
MSKIAQVGTEIRDAACLITVLKKQFKEVESHSTSQPLVGYDREDKKSAQIIVRKKDLGQHSFSDLGFARNTKGNYDCLIADFAYHRHFNQKWLDTVARDCSVEKSMRIMNERECELTGPAETLANGDVRMTFRVPVTA